LSGRGAEIRLSSLVETLSIASELTFAMEKEVLLKPYDFTNLRAPDIMAAISEMTQDQVCFVFRDYGILVTSRDTALRRSGASIPDLPLEQLEETPPPRSPLPEDVKKLLTKDDPLIFNFRPEDVQSGGGSELAKLFSLASGLQLKVDTKVSEESQAEGRPEYPRPYCFMINGNCLQLMQAVVEASNGVLSFVLADPSGFTLTDSERARALPGPGIQEVPLRPVTSEKQLTPPDSPPSTEATPRVAVYDLMAIVRDYDSMQQPYKDLLPYLNAQQLEMDKKSDTLQKEKKDFETVRGSLSPEESAARQKKIDALYEEYQADLKKRQEDIDDRLEPFMKPVVEEVEAIAKSVAEGKGYTSVSDIRKMHGEQDAETDIDITPDIRAKLGDRLKSNDSHRTGY
jgi:Skp family chaperone for outer membrane proteins